MQESNRVGLINSMPMVMGEDMEFVERTFAHAGYKRFPDSRRPARTQRMRAMVPTVEAAYHINFARIGSPERKIDTRYTVDDAQMGPHFFIDVILFPLSKQVQVEVTQDGGNILLSNAPTINRSATVDPRFIVGAIVLLCRHARPPRCVSAANFFCTFSFSPS